MSAGEELKKLPTGVYDDLKDKIIAQHLVEWLRVCCSHGDQLRLVLTPHVTALQNQRTGVLYMLDVNGDEP